jgi:hypothetical protein
VSKVEVSGTRYHLGFFFFSLLGEDQVQEAKRKNIPTDKSRHARRLDETMTTMERSRRGSGSSCHLKHKERDREIRRKQNIQALVCISKQLLFLLTCEAEAIANCNGAPATELQECSTTNNSIIIVKQTQTGPKKTQ